MKKEKANPLTGWTACLIAAFIAGVLAFIVVGAIFHERPLQYFFAAFAAYLMIGANISFLTGDKSLWFEKANVALGLLAFMAGIIFELRLEEAKLLGWPLIASGLILAVCSFIGKEMKLTD